MTALLETALNNVVMAALLAGPAALAGLWGRRPALTHGLWLLVLLKLVTPPLFEVPIAWPESPPLAALQPPLAALQPEPPADPVAPPPMFELPPPVVEPVALPDPLPAPEPPPAAPAAPVAPLPPPVPAAPPLADTPPPSWGAWLVLPWLTGSAVWLALVVRRLDRFRRLLRFATPAPDEVQAQARMLAVALGVRCPRVLLLPGAVSPMLWAAGRAPRLLLPAGLLDRLQPGQLATLLAHELAHWRRGDHRVRWLEVLVLALYWWCPLAWWARRQLHQAEEECCDAWVVAVLPDSARAYALALVETIDFLSGASAVLPPVASGVGHVRLLKRRLTMILRGTTPRSLTRFGLLAVAGLGFGLLPLVPGQAQQAPKAETPDALKAKLDPLLVEQQRLQEERVQKPLVQQDLAKKQQQLEATKAALEAQLKELHLAIERLKMFGGSAGSGPPPKVGPPAHKPQPGGMRPGGGSTKPASVEQRLEQIERKLDILLWEIANLRRDMPKHAPAPMAGPGNMWPPMPYYHVPGGKAYTPSLPPGSPPAVPPPPPPSSPPASTPPPPPVPGPKTS